VNGVATAASVGSSRGSQVSGIRVEARRGGQVLDADTTNTEGRFTLEFVGGGTVELIFVTERTTLRLELNASPGSVVTLVVELRIVEQEVVVVEESDPIRCKNGRFSVFDEDLDLLIDGGGDDCLAAESNCVLDIAVRSLTLVDCERCIEAQSNAEIVVSTFPGGVTCRAREDGIRAESSSFVSIHGHDGVEIIARSGSGIHAESNAGVLLAADGPCFIDAADGPIRIESQATVDLNGCADVVLVDDFDDDDFGDDDD
jgi:hypothetical protein